MFKWKVSGLGGKKEKSKNQQQQTTTRLNNEPQHLEAVDAKNNNKTKDNNSKKEKSKEGEVTQSPKSRGFRLFQSNSSNNNNGGNSNVPSSSGGGGGGPHGTVDTGTGTLSKDAIMSRVGQRLAGMSPSDPRHNVGPPQHHQQQMGFRMSNENLLNVEGDNGMPPPLPPLKPEWRQHMMTAAQGMRSNNTSADVDDDDEDEEAIPNDSLYGTQETVIQAGNGTQSYRERQYGSRPKLSDLAHWSSHGYLARDSGHSDQSGSGYVVLKRQGEAMVTMRSPTTQPQSLPLTSTSTLPSSNLQPQQENKYFSVRGYRDFTNKVADKMGPPGPEDREQSQKYFSVDAKFLHQQAAADMKTKLRENLKVSNTQQQQVYGNNNNNKPDLPQYYQPPPPPSYPPYQRPPPPQRQHSDLSKQTKQGAGADRNQKPSNLESSKAISGSVSWLEWTQQLQAYIAWVNSQLRKRPGLSPVTDLRTDLQSGEVLAQLIEIISGEKIAGILYQPESLQGMRENLERVLQFMASKKIRMHQISSREILEGNLKAVMRLILALAAHYKPQSVKHHDVSYDNIPDGKADTADKIEPHINDNVVSESRSLGMKEDRQTDCQSTPDYQTRHSPAVKRSPSLNDSHYGPSAKARLGTDPTEVFSQLERKHKMEMKPSVETQTHHQTARNLTVSPPVSGTRGETRGLNNEGFTRTGSGRKLPQIPDRNRNCNTLPTRKVEEEPEEENVKLAIEENAEADSRKPSKPKALEFWESMENIERNDFRYNTIHRMSMGRRLLPKPPDASSSAPTTAPHARSQSVDRSESSNEAEKLSLNSSFSGPTSLPNQKSDGDSSVPHSPRSFHKIPPDGASLQSHNSETGHEISLDCRREAEGSSNNNSPPTSVIQGIGEESQNVWELAKPNQNPAYDWVRGSFDRASDNGGGNTTRRKWGLPSPVTTIGQDFNISDELLKKMSTSKDPKDKIIPYDVLLEDLSQAKRQLLELHNLLLNNMATSSTSEGVQGSNLSSVRRDLRRAKQECVNLEGSKLGLQTRLAEQEANISNLKQTLLRVTLAKQSLESEKKDLMRKVEEMTEERGVELADQRKQSGDRLVYYEELRVARDAISNLRSSFADSDPNQHILDTLEQCISVIVERMVEGGSKPGSRMSNSELSDAGSGSVATTATKVVYFTPRSVTPFMTSIMKPVGKITLRDFKSLFDRPGFYRYHFKTMDKEFGMVKEEIAEDDKILPGVEGKIVVWVEEE